jgi:hypothetical protein
MNGSLNVNGSTPMLENNQYKEYKLLTSIVIYENSF